MDPLAREKIAKTIEDWAIPCLHHFTDASNLSSICYHEGLLSLVAQRKQSVICSNHLSDDRSRDLDASNGLDKYVHLAFHKDHSMLRHARPRSLSGIALLKVSTSVMYLPGVLFTKDVANQSANPAQFSMDKLDEVADLEAMYPRGTPRRYDLDTSLGKWKRAEVLVPSFVPMNLIGDITIL